MGFFQEKFLQSGLFQLTTRKRSLVSMNTEHIKTYCEEARKIAGLEGTSEGLAFLIGEKFSRILHEINKCQNKIKFLYPKKNPFGEVPASLGEQSLKLSYALTVSSNYGDHLEKLNRLETTRDAYIQEIKKTFALKEIQDYLNAHPRLGWKQKSIPYEEADLEENLGFSVENLLSEVEDIFLVDSMKKLFGE